MSSIPAIKKMDYICLAINKAGFKVNIISPSWMGMNSKKKRIGTETRVINHKTKVSFFPSWKTKNKLTLGVKIIFNLVYLFLYLIINTKKNEKVLVYHSQWISVPIRLAKFLKRFELILEVEEIYGAVWDKPKLMSHMENKLINAADSYIFVSDLLKKQIIKTKSNKKNLILYGGYDPVYLVNNKKDNSVINLVYAGAIDLTRGGAFNAIEIMKFLPDNYKLHILGHGNPEQISKLQEEIKVVNEEKQKEICFYKGSLHGQVYTDYLLKMNIALNPQNQGEYMNTAFPSKILSYLSHNLRVVSTKIDSIKQSRISDYVFFAEHDTPDEFARTIKSIDLSSNYKSSEFIKQLDIEFVNEINLLLRN